MRALALICLGLTWGCGTPDDTSDKDTDVDETDATETDVTETDADTDVAETDDSDSMVTTDPCLAEPTVLRLGTGETSFETITPGQDLQMVNGPQGGWHLNVSLEVENAPQLARVEVKVTDIESSTVVTADDPLSFNIALVPDVLGTWECEGSYAGLQAVLDFSTMGATGETPDPWNTLCGHEAQIDLVMKTADGDVYASATTNVVVQPDPANGPYCVELSD